LNTADDADLNSTLFEQVSRLHAERVSKSLNDRDRRITGAAFDVADIGAMILARSANASSLSPRSVRSRRMFEPRRARMSTDAT
jgi:hypothetical protein